MANPFAAATRIQAGGWNATFQGARTSRLLFDWAVSALHPDREIRWALRHLRGRARDLVRNNPYAAGIVEAFADNVIGTGIRARPQAMDPRSGESARDVNRRLRRGWNEWDAPEYASVDGQESWLEIQRLLIKTWVTDGEVFLRERPGYPNRFGYALQMLDADLLDETFNRPPDQNGVEIRMGVEINADGRHLAYHFFEAHPSLDGRGRERRRIPADQIIHHFVRYRPGQTRGYSLFAPVLTTIKMIDGLSEAELVASRMAAATMGFIQNNNPEAVAVYAQKLRMLADRGKDAKAQKLEIAPALINELQPGQTFEGFDPNHPTDAFEPFLKVMLRGVARGFSMSYLTLTGDVADANYSSMRAGLIPERDHWKVLQTICASKVHRRCYRSWIGTSLLTRALDLPTAAPSDYYDVEWRGRGWKWVDPLKDLQAAEIGIAIGVESRGRIAAEQGRDYEDIVEDIADEEEFAEARGVDVSVNRKRAMSPARSEDDDVAPGPSRNGTAPSNRIAAMTRRAHGAD